jgi:hypothetical protein
MSFETVAGSVLGVSASAPATYDLAGYGASAMVYTAVGEITDLGGSYGRQYNVVSHAPISTSQVTQKKGGFTLNPIELMMAWDQSDSGQDILRTAAATNSILTFELIKQGGDRRYFTAQVSKFVENMGTVDNVVQGSVTLLPQRDIVMNPA